MTLDDDDDGPGAGAPSAARDGVRVAGRRRRTADRRTHRVRFFVDDAEQAVLQAAARRAGKSTGAWVATVAVATARTALRPPERRTSAAPGPIEPGERLRRLAAARDEANAAWHQLRRVGGLLNQVATVGNATGALPPHTGEVLERVARVTERVDAAAAELRAAAAQHHGRPR